MCQQENRKGSLLNSTDEGSQCVPSSVGRDSRIVRRGLFPIFHVGHVPPHSCNPVSPHPIDRNGAKEGYFHGRLRFSGREVLRLLAAQKSLPLNGRILSQVDGRSNEPRKALGDNVTSVPAEQMNPVLAEVPGDSLSLLL